MVSIEAGFFSKHFSLNRTTKLDDVICSYEFSHLNIS